jgi:hypothetical protein
MIVPSNVSEARTGPPLRNEIFTAVHSTHAFDVFLNHSLFMISGHAVAYLFEALCYRLEGRRFESR